MYAGAMDVTIGSVELRKVPAAPLVALLRAEERWDPAPLERLVVALLERGCIQFCCVGARAEEVHDAIDWIVEERDRLEIVTTWHAERVEAVDYVRCTAGLAGANVLALVEGDPTLVELLAPAHGR